MPMKARPPLDQVQRYEFKGATLLWKPLTHARYIELADLFSEHRMAALLGASTGALCGWEGVVDEAGADLPYSNENVERLPTSALQTLGMHIITGSTLSEDDRGN